MQKILNDICHKIIPKKRKFYQAEPYSMAIYDAVSLGVTHYYFTD